jgi:hypothetical protein
VAAPSLLKMNGEATAVGLWEAVQGSKFLNDKLPTVTPFAESAVKFIGGATQPLLGWAGESGVKVPLSGGANPPTAPPCLNSNPAQLCFCPFIQL